MLQPDFRTRGGFGDVVWTARVKGGKLEAWEGPVDINKSQVRVSALRFLAHRWMS